MDQFTYEERGATDRPFPERFDGGWPAGYTVMVESHEIEAEDPSAAFIALTEGILAWELHRRAGLTMDAGAERAAPAVRVVSGFGVGPARIKAPCRVLWTRGPQLDGTGRAVPGQRGGFGYGTLPGHPVKGEEGFYAELTADNRLVFICSAYSVPATLVFRLASPVTRLTQRYVLSRYVKAARELAASA
ncbi:DUF1990 family protein [Arthrobacter agilis]|uniref:DUF1990 family protein n=1 Tax=Arthrobacter agilis TaxID=37921 RepID=UPI002789A1D6|nr:DUF1990 domain-containing protein [Arthrobacter agilis]MDQ0736992.1 uncharacterized protein (UPF0548 family) [Arthrobacter agilis]